jgi:hypothetical protein
MRISTVTLAIALAAGVAAYGFAQSAPAGGPPAGGPPSAGAPGGGAPGGGAPGGQSASKTKLDFHQAFNAMDTNHDGKITKEEWLAAGMSQFSYDHLFQMLDSKKQGYLTYADFAQEPMFEIDFNKDGKITLDEYRKANNEAGEKIQKGGGGSPGGSGGPGGPGGAGGPGGGPGGPGGAPPSGAGAPPQGGPQK